MKQNLIEIVKQAYKDAGESAALYTIGMSSDGEFDAYYSNHSDNWVTIGNLAVLYNQIVSRFGN